jgi:hypothetical protein
MMVQGCAWGLCTPWSPTSYRECYSVVAASVVLSGYLLIKHEDNDSPAMPVTCGSIGDVIAIGLLVKDLVTVLTKAVDRKPSTSSSWTNSTFFTMS